MSDWNTLYDKIIVERHAADKMVRGLAVAETHERRKNTGTVLSVGSGRLIPGNTYTVPLIVIPGHEVLFHEHAGVPLEPDNDDIIILREDEILAYRTPKAAASLRMA